MKKLYKIILIVCICNLFFIAQANSDKYNEALQIITQRGDYNQASEIFWNILLNDYELDMAALQSLSALYKNNASFFISGKLKQWKIGRKMKNYNKYNCDLTLLKSYLPKVADKFYPIERAEKKNPDIIIIASEDHIIGQAIYNLQNRVNGKKQGLRRGPDTVFAAQAYDFVSVAIDTIKKDIKITGKKGEFLSRSRNFDGLGVIAVVDKTTAKEQFDFPEGFPIEEWCVFVRSPYDKNVLIPFANFHRFVYQKKMADFIEICKKLGAKKIKVYREQTDKTGERKIIGVNGGVTTYDAAIQASTESYEAAKEGDNVLTSYSDPGTFRIKSFESPWFGIEPTWKTMYDGRQVKSPIQPQLTEYKAEFNYSEAYGVNYKAAVAFSNAQWHVGVHGELSKEMFHEIKWIMQVEFYPIRIRKPF